MFQGKLANFIFKEFLFCIFGETCRLNFHLRKEEDKSQSAKIATWTQKELLLG